MWCGFQNSFYLLQDREQRYPAPPHCVPPHWGLVFTAVNGATSDPAHPERLFPLVSDALPELCWLLTAPPLTTLTRHCFRYRHSRRQSWIPPSSPSGQQVPGVTVMICSIDDTAHGQLQLHHQPTPVLRLQTFLLANHLHQRLFQEAHKASFMSELLSCESLVHS